MHIYLRRAFTCGQVNVNQQLYVGTTVPENSWKVNKKWLNVWCPLLGLWKSLGCIIALRWKSGKLFQGDYWGCSILRKHTNLMQSHKSVWWWCWHTSTDSAFFLNLLSWGCWSIDWARCVAEIISQCSIFQLNKVAPGLSEERLYCFLCVSV